ncbi:hypothetical protein AAG747_03900 [Rapidithrix thailandica]|uniref:Uncharacterized protein n=1 Tax=Rapidithrix thailandica TaxID=413964 RepID=A0AAW9RQI0_9BACT
MKTLQVLIFSLSLAFYISPINAQTINWNATENAEHLLSIGVGWDYSLSYNMGYTYRSSTKIPWVLNTRFSMPSGEKLLDDFKVKIGGQVVLINGSNFKMGIILNGIYRRFENPLVRLQNFGSEIKGVFGYYREKWFVGGEIGFDKAIVTHFKHSDSFKQNILSEVKDGWYEPAAGGHFLYGIQTGYSFKKSDLTLNIGKVIRQDFKATPLIPYYLMLGYNHRIH